MYGIPFLYLFTSLGCFYALTMFRNNGLDLLPWIYFISDKPFKLRITSRSLIGYIDNVPDTKGPSRLFVEQLVQTCNKGKIRASNNCPFVRESTGRKLPVLRTVFPCQEVIMVGGVFRAISQQKSEIGIPVWSRLSNLILRDHEEVGHYDNVWLMSLMYPLWQHKLHVIVSSSRMLRQVQIAQLLFDYDFRIDCT